MRLCETLCNSVLQFLLLLLLLLLPFPAFAAVPGPDDGSDPSAITDTNQSFEDLLDESQELMLSKRPIDARAKLQKALQMNPQDYRPYMLLGQYYLFDVGHFTLAYRYILSAEELFMKKNGSAEDLVDPEQSRAHATLLYLRSEAELNLDKYADSLKTLDRFGSLYMTDWYPGTRAWVLMKLKRIDEAIMVAQSALLDPTGRTDRRRTYNILGILLSVKGQRELSLKAFQQAIAAEVSLGSAGQVATPLNNAGEVYRELFRDELAEASWIRATRLPDGCDHILPSLNLAILYIDEARFLQAERTLSDFEACFAQQGERADTEHRALLALARGRIALREGNVDEAIKQLTAATERQQWFGKIGTNEDDVQFAATIAMAQAYEAKIAVIHDTAHDHWKDALVDEAQIPELQVRSWWLYRQARAQGVDELSDLEDLFIRNTDTMVEYPTFGTALRGFPVRSFRKRIDRMMKDDERPRASSYYELYLAENLLAHGDDDEAEKMLLSVEQSLRPIDRLAKAQLLTDLLVLHRDRQHFWSRPSHDELVADIKRREDLYGILPSNLRYSDLLLPVTFTGADSETLRTVKGMLTRRFEEQTGELQTAPRYQIQLSSVSQPDGEQIYLKLLDRTTNMIRASETGVVKTDGSGKADLVNKFIAASFSHRTDPPGEPVPPLDLVEGIM